MPCPTAPRARRCAAWPATCSGAASRPRRAEDPAHRPAMTETTRASADPAPPPARDDGAPAPKTAIGFGRAMAAVTFLFVALLVLHLAAQPGARALERLIGLVASVTCDEKGLAALI